MIIRKKFNFEAAHIVRNAFSERCANNIHWHSYEIEVFLWGADLDSAWMLIDFWLIKQKLYKFIDYFDHSIMLWDKPEDDEFLEFFINNFDRVIITSSQTSAEQQAKMFFLVFKDLLVELFYWTSLYLEKVIVHETKSWYAEYWKSDYKFEYSPLIKTEYSRDEKLEYIYIKHF